MKPHALFVLCIAALGAALAMPSQAVDPASATGLVAVRSPDLDQLLLRPNVDLAGYHKILVDPAPIAFRSDFNKTPQDTLAFTRRLYSNEVQQIATDTAAGLQEAVTQAFTTHGYEVVTAPGSGVLRLSPSAVDLFIDAPAALPAGKYPSFTQQDDGEATLVLEARDSVSGTLLGRVVDHRHAAKTYRTLTRTTNVAENFWFENMFREWAATCAKEFAATTPSRISLAVPR